MRIKIASLIVCSALAVLLTSCQDAREIDDMTYITAIGIDKGVSDTLRYTFEYPALTQGGQSSSGGGGGGQQETYKTVTVDEHTFFEAFDILNTVLPREINLMHLKLICISEDIAKSGKLADFLTPVIRFREIRRETNFAVIKGSTMDFLNANQPGIGTSLYKSLENIFRTSMTTAYTPDTRLKDFYDDIKSDYSDAIIPLGGVNTESQFQEDGKKYEGAPPIATKIAVDTIPVKGGNTVNFFGTALFSGAKMVGELDGSETRHLLLVRGDFQRAVFIIKDPMKENYYVAIYMEYQKGNKVGISFENGKAVIDLKIYLEGEIRSIQSRINYESEELKPLLEKAIAAEIRENVDKVINKCKALKVDVFNFGSYAQEQFLTIEDWQKYNWLENFDKVQVNTEVSVVIRRSGSIQKNATIFSGEGND